MLLASFLFTIALGTAAVPQDAGAFPADPTSPASETAGAEQSQSPSPPPRNTVTLRWENDILSGTDQNYSNGLSLAFTREGPGLLGGIWEWFGATEGRWSSTYELAQLIMTPTDVTRSVPDPADRPYAGLLFGAVSTQFVHGNQFEGLRLMVGVVGPAALAAQAQNRFHELFGIRTSNGWDYQIRNEAVANVVYEHRGRYTLLDADHGWSVDLVPVVGGMLGNAFIQAQADTQVRVGHDMPEDFGSTLMRGVGTLPFPPPRQASHQFGFCIFAGGGATAVARNITLDGNTLRDSPRVPKRPAFAGAQFGVTFWKPTFEMTVSYVVWGREYETQPQLSRFGAATLAFHF